MCRWVTPHQGENTRTDVQATQHLTDNNWEGVSNGRQVLRSPPRNFQRYCQVIISSFIITATTKLPCSLFGAGGWFVGYLLLPLPPPTNLFNRATTCYHYHHQPPPVVVLLLSCAMIAAVVCSAQPYSTTALLPLREPSDSIASSSFELNKRRPQPHL